MVTYPFDLERVRKVKAEEGIQKLRKFCDSVIILDNNRLVKLVPNLPMNDAFALADEVLAKAIGGLVWTITQPSLINIDFADVRVDHGQRRRRIHSSWFRKRRKQGRSQLQKLS
jgi:cell division protein FtsZ